MPSVDDLCRSYLDVKWHFDPAAASADGAVAEDHRLGRFDREAVREYVAALRSMAGAVEDLDVDDLQDEIDRTALLGEMRVAISRWEREQPHLRNPSLPLSHLFGAIYAVLRRAPNGAAGDPSDGRAAAILARLKDAPQFLDAALTTLDAPPAVFVDTALGMLGGGGELIVQTARILGAEAPAAVPELNTATAAALEALTRYGRALRGEVEPDGDPHAFALGEAQFSRRLHYEHALRAEAPELWRYGLHLQEEVEAELAAAAKPFGGSWRDVVARLREETPAAGQLLETYHGELDRARTFLVAEGVVSVPEDRLEIVATPPFLMPLVPFAAYEPPPVHLGGQSGRFYVTSPAADAPPEVAERQLREHGVHAIPALVAHEAYPGHHLQLSTAHRLRSEVRRHLSTPVMVEGWALYSEQLMAELGYYRTPEARLFRLVNLLWRAVRIVLDVGLHTRGTTPAEAVQYLTDHLPMERSNAEAEVRRYCAYPTYQLSYALGRRELLSLREAYRARAGTEFSLRRFHDDVLAYGGLPVSLARWGMGLDAEA